MYKRQDQQAGQDLVKALGAGDDDGLGSAGEGHGQEQAVQAIDVVAVEVGAADQVLSLIHIWVLLR